MNHRIYDNAKRLNKYITGSDNDLYNETSDFNYNKKLSEIHMKQKHDKIFNQNEFNIQEQIEKQNQQYKEYMLQSKINNQKNYKQFLDYQYKEKRNKPSPLIESGEQLLMPSYRYPNLPKPYAKKAFDSLSYFERTPNKNDIFTIRKKNTYLGDSSLRHNPITCPIDDIQYNRYVNSSINSMPKFNSDSGSDLNRSEPNNINQYNIDNNNNFNANNSMTNNDLTQGNQSISQGNTYANNSLNNNNVKL